MKFGRLDYFLHFFHLKDSFVVTHHHRSYELTYYFEGSGTSSINDVEYTYSKNTFFVYKPMSNHNEKHSALTKVFCVNFYLDPSYSIDEGPYSDDGTILDILRRMHEENTSQLYGYNDMLSILLQQLILNLLRNQKENDSSKYGFISDFKKYINSNFNLDIDFVSAAENSGYSYDHFRHLFKKEMNISPAKYLASVRLKHAKSLLASGTLSIADVAIQCGFNDISNFSFAFKKAYGISPSEYRKTVI